MSDDVLRAHRIDPVVPEFVPDAALDALYREAVAVARKFGWTVPSREDFEAHFKEEMAAKRNPCAGKTRPKDW